MKRLLLLSAFLCFLISISYSQSSYYVKGNAKILNPKYQLILKDDRHEWDPYHFVQIRIRDSVHTYTPKQVKEYKKDGKVYVAEPLPSGTMIFFELLEDGYLRLYYYIDKDFRKRYFIKKEGERLIEIVEKEKHRSNFRKVLRKNWDQCKKTRKLTDKAEFNRSSLKRTVKAHNTCKEIYFPRVKYSIAAGAGMSQPELSFGKGVESLAFEGIYRNFSYSFKVSYQGSIGVSIPINQTNFSFETGLRFQTMKFDLKTFFSLNAPLDREFEANIELADLAIPIDVQYTIPNLKYRPFFRVGLSPNLFVSNKMIITERILAGVSVENETISNEELKSFGIGLNIAFGFQQQISEKGELQFTVGYYRRGATNSKRIYNFSNFYYTIGYAF